MRLKLLVDDAHNGKRWREWQWGQCGARGSVSLRLYDDENGKPTFGVSAEDSLKTHDQMVASIRGEGVFYPELAKYAIKPGEAFLCLGHQSSMRSRFGAETATNTPPLHRR